MLARYPDSYGAIAIEVMATHSSKPRETLYLSVGIYSIAAKVSCCIEVWNRTSTRAADVDDGGGLRGVRLHTRK